MTEQVPGIFKPALISGAIFGVAAALPILKYINVACCALTIASGFVAAWMVSKVAREHGARFDVGVGAKVGVLAGVFYGLFTTLASGLMFAVTGGTELREVADMMSQQGAPEWVIEAFTLLPMVLVFQLIMGLIFGVIFATVGGLIAGAVFKIEKPFVAAPPPPAPGA